MMPNLPLTEKKNFVLHSPEIKQPNADGQSDHRHNFYAEEQYKRSDQSTTTAKIQAQNNVNCCHLEYEHANN